MTGKIAVCISTHNRPESFAKTISGIKAHLPDDARIFVIDDASEMDYADADYRFAERSGIPAVKNKCIELAMDWEADHIFLFDDDVWPIADHWHLPYIRSGQHHLCYTFLHEIEARDGITIHGLGNGCMLYFSRHCIDTIGGFDTDFGKGKFEHVEMSRRIHNAGLTPYVFMDVVESDKLFHSMDEYDEIQRTMTDREMDELIRQNAPLFYAKQNDKHFKPYKDTVS